MDPVFPDMPRSMLLTSLPLRVYVRRVWKASEDLCDQTYQRRRSLEISRLVECSEDTPLSWCSYTYFERQVRSSPGWQSKRSRLVRIQDKPTVRHAYQHMAKESPFSHGKFELLGIGFAFAAVPLKSCSAINTKRIHATDPVLLEN